ncbi:MAG: hypothetical protein COB85_08815, partial [Bacteroidetes bacterium]
MPITNGFRITPFCCNAHETAHGSPSHSSIPSVIKMIMFLHSVHTGKSFAACSREYAIKVVPLGTICSSFFFILGTFPLLKGTSSQDHVDVDGDGNQMRDFVFVEDVVEASIRAAQKDIVGI